MAGDESSAHCNIFLGADLSIVVRPALAGIVKETNPQQIVFGAVVDQQMRVSLSLRRNDWDWGIKLHGGHMACSITGVTILKRYLRKTVPAWTKLRAGILDLQHRVSRCR